MRSEKNRSFLPMSLVPALLVVSAIAVLATQEVRTQSVRATNWSDPATWPNSKVPAAGDKVTIGKDKEVVLDVSPPALGGLTIDGKLSFANNADLELTTEWIMLHGELADRHRSQAPHPQGDHHPHRQRQGRRRHGRHG